MSGTPADTARLLERLTDNLIAVSTQQAHIAERLEGLKNGLELVASNLESSKTQQAAVSAASEASLADLIAAPAPDSRRSPVHTRARCVAIWRAWGAS